MKLHGKGHRDSSSALRRRYVQQVVLWDILCVIVIVVNYKVAIVLLGSLAWLLGLAAASWLLCLGLGSHERIRLGRERYVRGHGGARIAA